MKGQTKRLVAAVPGAVYVLAISFVVAAVRYDSFLTFLNLTNVLRQSGVLAIAAIGMTLCIVSGTIDLSLGMMLGLAGVIAVKFGDNLLLTLGLTLVVFAFIGWLKGVVITKLRLAPMIVTLAFMFLIRGLIFILNGPSSVQLPKGADAFRFLGRGYVGAIPFPVVLLFAVTIAFALAMRHTPFGRHLYAVGGNFESAKMMGIRAERVQIWAQVLCSICVGLAGLIMTARQGALTPLQGENFETKAITAAVLGGASLAGGSGSIWGTVAGALFLSIVSNMFNLQGNIPSAWQNIISGGLMVAIVVVQSSNLIRALRDTRLGRMLNRGAPNAVRQE